VKSLDCGTIGDNTKSADLLVATYYLNSANVLSCRHKTYLSFKFTAEASASRLIHLPFYHVDHEV